MLTDPVDMTAMTANDRFILIKVKIERAKKCLSDLESKLSEFRNEHFYAVITENDPKIGETIQGRVGGPYPKKYRILPFDALAIAGDLVHNLRCALDHLANQLVWVGSDSEPSRGVCFPIAKDAASYERDKAGKVKGMCPKAIKAIDALKPYKGGNNPLWRIRELDDIDKHRTLFTYAHDCFLVADWLEEFPEFCGSPYGGLSPYLLKASNPNFSGVFDGEVEQDVEREIDEAVGKTKVAISDTLLPSLSELIDYVENLVLTFRPFLQ